MYKRNDQFIAALPQALIPEVAKFHSDRKRIENALAAIDIAVELAFAEAYYNDKKGYNTDGFYDMVAGQLEALKKAAHDAAVQIEIKRQARQIAAQMAIAGGCTNAGGLNILHYFNRNTLQCRIPNARMHCTAAFPMHECAALPRYPQNL